MIVIPTAIADKYRKERERNAIRFARHKYGRRSPVSRDDYKNKFIAWDGEGPKDAGYALLGNSEGDEICHPYLSSVECLNLLMDCSVKYPGAIHIGYGFNYDVTNIIKDLPKRCHVALNKHNRCVWNEFQIQHIPHKWFEVRRGNQRIKIYDIHSYFGCGYLDALKEFGLGSTGDLGTIDSGKKSRRDFVYADIDKIRQYFRTELRLMPELAEYLRTAFSDAGYLPRAWYGPGAIARLALRRHGIKAAMAESPTAVKLAALYAFAAGRFELFLGGHTNRPVVIADIHSAYPWFATSLPNLAKGKWRHSKRFEEDKFAVYRIRYESTPQANRPYPLFRRMPGGEVCWPYRVTGWYWQPEAELVKDDPDAKILEGWVFDESDIRDRPFAWLSDYYDRRLLLKRLGNAAQYTFKLIINSVYGQLAQRAGWDKKHNSAPTYHQIEWAGYITSACRAAVYRVAEKCGENLVSIDTDGVTSLAPFEGLDIGEKLGQWEVTNYEDGIFWQSGIYCLKTSDCRIKSCSNYMGDSTRCGHEWPANKTRGIPKDSYSYKELLACLRSGEPLRLISNTFVTYTQALIGDYSRYGSWEQRPIEYDMGGSGKRVHLKKRCKTTCKRADGLHTLVPLHHKYSHFCGSAETMMHHLPWLKHAKEMEAIQQAYDELSVFTSLDDEFEWIKTLSA